MKWVFSILFVVSAIDALAQGTFQDLDFEEANVNQPYPNALTVANALPGWTVYYGTYQQTGILYNDPSLGQTAVSLEARGYLGSFGATVDGNFSVLLQGGSFPGPPSFGTANAIISQTGLIPIGTQSLLFDINSGTQVIVPDVLIGNDLLTLFPLGTGVGTGTTYNGTATSYAIYGANISAWAGQAEQITFSASYGNILLDDISFSPNPITVTPEPDAVTLMGIGGAFFAAYRRFAPNRK